MPDLKNFNELPPLTLHEMKIQQLLMRLSGTVLGFPDDDAPKLDRVTRAWAQFASTEPYHVHFNPQIEPYMTDADKKPYLWKEGIVPAEWLVHRVRDACEFMPTPIVAREIYCGAGFRPEDGLMPDELTGGFRKRPQSEIWEDVDITKTAS